VFGKTSSIAGVNATLTKISDIQFIQVVDNKLTVSTGIVLKHMLSQLQGQSSALLANLKNLSGTFNTKFVVSNLSLRSEGDKTGVKGLSVSIPGIDQPAVNGLGVQGILTIP
jgi:hypothetical protein